jgi:hypothetical protein
MNAEMNQIESKLHLFGRCRFRGKRREKARPEAGQAGHKLSFDDPNPFISDQHTAGVSRRV